jgi:hypothetical protein
MYPGLACFSLRLAIAEKQASPGYEVAVYLGNPILNTFYKPLSSYSGFKPSFNKPVKNG